MREQIQCLQEVDESGVEVFTTLLPSGTPLPARRHHTLGGVGTASSVFIDIYQRFVTQPPEKLAKVRDSASLLKKKREKPTPKMLRVFLQHADHFKRPGAKRGEAQHQRGVDDEEVTRPSSPLLSDGVPTIFLLCAAGTDPFMFPAQS